MKSNVSDLLELVECIYIDASMKCTADVFDSRDLSTIRSRVEAEGLSFLTITLSNFCQDFERSLEIGFIDSTLFSNFKKERSGPIPSFLKGMVSQVFDPKTGELYDDKRNPHHQKFLDDIATVIEGIRQICLAFKKVELQCTPERVHKALDNYINVEAQFSEFLPSEQEICKFLQVSDYVWGNIFGGINPRECIPRHGPGATAERISGNRKYDWQEWYDRLDTYFPYIGFAVPIGMADSYEEIEKVSIIPPEQERPVRVITVPKTLKTPRVIAIEPVCMQFVQQGIRDILYRMIESSSITGGQINFSDQSVNQKIALTSSVDRQYSTIDLSDASDRVPLKLALCMFRTNPDLMDSIMSCRSTLAELPNGRVIGPLSKFASMGSALCFPIEAMYFYTICIVALLDAQQLSYTIRNILSVSKLVYVYGDDIIVPSTYAVIVLDYLQKYNCKVNSQKTFVTGKFRESCGVEAYLGYEVTPTYFRVLPPKHKRQAAHIISWIATANLFYKRGYWRCANSMFKTIEKLVGSIPYVSENSEAIGRISYLGYRTIGRWHDKLHRFEVKAMVPRPIYRTDKLEGYGALMKCFLKMEGKLNFPRPSLVTSSSSTDDLIHSVREEDPLHLERTALHGGVALNHRWVSAH